MNKYYNIAPLLSHNAYISICFSGRGQGKSFQAKKKIINNFLKKGEQTVYCRRNKSELELVKDTFFNDIKDHYPDHEFTVEGFEGYIDGELAIYFIPLSVSSSLKSASFHGVTLFIFDEYVITKSSHNRYLKNEMTLLLDLWETIFRDREKSRVIILSNSVSFVNPLFSFFDIVPKQGQRFQKFKDGLIVLELFTSDKFVEEKLKTPWGRLVQGTTYGDYAIGNSTLEDNNDFIEPKPPGSYRFVASFKNEGFEIGVWYNKNTRSFYVDEKIDKLSIFRFGITADGVEPGIKRIKEYRKTWQIKDTLKAYDNNNIAFISQEVKKFFINNVVKYL